MMACSSVGVMSEQLSKAVIDCVTVISTFGGTYSVGLEVGSHDGYFVGTNVGSPYAGVGRRVLGTAVGPTVGTAVGSILG
jgi:hypothetical protein